MEGYTTIIFHFAYNIMVVLFPGAELRNWLLYFALPVLRGVLPNLFLSHFALFVGAIYLYSSQRISYQEHQLGQSLLEQFYEQFSALYGRPNFLSIL